MYIKCGYWLLALFSRHLYLLYIVCKAGAEVSRNSWKVPHLSQFNDCWMYRISTHMLRQHLVFVCLYSSLYEQCHRIWNPRINAFEPGMIRCRDAGVSTSSRPLSWGLHVGMDVAGHCQSGSSWESVPWFPWVPKQSVQWYCIPSIFWSKKEKHRSIDPHWPAVFSGCGQLRSQVCWADSLMNMIGSWTLNSKMGVSIIGVYNGKAF